MRERIILHSDMNNCYASIERKMDPTLEGKPLIVCGSKKERHGIVLAKSQEAKAFGIVTGEPVTQAHQKCPGLIEVRPHYGEYIKVSKAAKAIYAQYTDLIEPYGLDECWLDVTGSTLLFGDGEQIANRIREEIKEKLGITVSIGVSFNKIFAKLGSDMKKPDAVTVISRENFRQKVWPLPVSELWGVGHATARKLSPFGIHTIGDLAAADRDALQRILGKAGPELAAFAAGEDTSRVMPDGYCSPVKSVGHGVTTMQDLKNNEQVWLMVYRLAQDVSHRLYQAGLAATGVSIAVRDTEMVYTEYQGKTELAVCDPYSIAKTAFQLFTKNYPWAQPIRAVTVRAIGLRPENEAVQLSFFRSAARDEKKERLSKAADRLWCKYDKNVVMAASLWQEVYMPPEETVNRVMPAQMYR